MSCRFAQVNLHSMGQEPPDGIPKRFPPDSLLANASWFWHGPPLFSPDLNEMHWNNYVIRSAIEVSLENVCMKIEGDRWSSVLRPGYAKTNYHEKNPFLTPDGDEVYFMSENRPGD